MAKQPQTSFHKTASKKNGSASPVMGTWMFENYRLLCAVYISQMFKKKNRKKEQQLPKCQAKRITDA